MGLDMKTRQKLTEETAKRYCQAEKKEKGKILDEFTATTGYNRKYAIHILRNTARIKVTRFNNCGRKSVQLTAKAPRKKRVYVKRYGGDVRQEVIRLWVMSRYMCAARLKAFITDNLEYFAGKHTYTPELKSKLGTVSSATIGRMLKSEIPKHTVRGFSTTRPAKNLNALIPIRVYFDWDERKPGFFEADTVANCGMSTEGQFLTTLTLTDVYSGWTELRALLNRAQRWVKEGVDDIKKGLPFPMKGLDSDNGGEFKNLQLLEWCRMNGVQFTRSRSYRKNDNCFVEQKNDSVVRHLVGYYRFEGEEARDGMAELYGYYNDLVNYFFPSMKILSKERVDAKVIKKYDAARTPYTRLMECAELPQQVKDELMRRKKRLDLETLLLKVDELQTRLISMAVSWVK